MIDKNDVRMPRQKEGESAKAIANDPEKVRQIEALLDLVNEANPQQELRLGEDYYGKFHWFGGTKQGKSYFSYQEEAVYDFIFNLNKSGILSDQVGMGKTIEAGMIISELASRNELRSLLIIVPNEIMAEKWEYELAEKFGIREYRRVKDGMEEVYPRVKALNNYDDFCRSVFDCLAEEKFVSLSEYKFQHVYKATAAKTLEEILASFVSADIKKAVAMINEGFEINGLSARVAFDGKKFSIGTKFTAPYQYDAKGDIRTYLNGRQNQKPEAVVNSKYFYQKYQTLIKQELAALYALVGHFFTTMPEEIAGVAEMLTNHYPILVIPISYSVRRNGKVELEEFLNRSFSEKVKNYKHEYSVLGRDGKNDTAYEEYRIIDFFIDVGYQTLIVDEVHDYINVEKKIDREEFHKNENFANFPSGEYDRYELFDDYYFIRKSSLYKKLKQLADKAQRKIFLTATPIKSDMVDFYLLTLLASNKDSEMYRKIRLNLDDAFPDVEEKEEAVKALYQNFVDCVSDISGERFCSRHSTYMAHERNEDGTESDRLVYPYFKNSYLEKYRAQAEKVTGYLKGYLTYMTKEEVVLDLIISYGTEKKDMDSSVLGIRETFDDINELLGPDGEERLQTRVVFRTLLDNSLRTRFEESFTTEDGEHKQHYIKRIRELLELPDGPRRWFKTYKSYGIRHTRHQTFNLSDCEHLEKLNKKKGERYKNLPLWPRRDGKMIFLVRDDIFFDSFLNVKRDRGEQERAEVHMEDLPNIEQITGDEEEREAKFRAANAIFDYINDSMSGGLPETHEPQSSRYESVDLDDQGMVDYKLALVNKLMVGRDEQLGSVRGKVLLFAENDREAITEWFTYQSCQPLGKGAALDSKKLAEYRRKWSSYAMEELGSEWSVSEDTGDLDRVSGNLLVIIDPKRFEKGIDLQKADTIINFDIKYDPLKMEQRIGRIDRIRPSGQSQKINIVSFVPLNDMSGFIINFFANEMKMFTQWMGETTGIVSVPDEENGRAAGEGEAVSFEDRVLILEKYYKDIYTLCSKSVDKKTASKMAEEFSKMFESAQKHAEKGGAEIDFRSLTEIDFRYLAELRECFDTAFRNSLSPLREGYSVTDEDGEKQSILRFNSTLGVFNDCVSGSCKNCRNGAAGGACRRAGSPKRNVYADFSKAVREFFEKSAKFLGSEIDRIQTKSDTIHGSSGAQKELVERLESREKQVQSYAKAALAELPAESSELFTIPLEKFNAIFEPMKEIYWGVVEKYMQIILEQFYKQCDNVLNGAKIFEKFIKTFSIADFIKNMEGNA